MTRDSMLEKLGSVGFLTLFPAFCIYHVFLAEGVVVDGVQNYLQGWFGPASLVLLFLFAIKFALQKRVAMASLGLVLTIYFLSWALISFCWLLFSEGLYVYDAFIQSLNVLLLSITMFFVGRYSARLNERAVLRIVYIFFFSYCAYTLLNFDKSTLMLHTYLQGKGVDGVASYQGFSRSLIVLSFLIYCIEMNQVRRYLTALFCITLLFFTGGRAEFAVFIISVIVFEVLSYKWRPKKIVYDVFWSIALVLFGLIFLDVFGERVADSRIYNLLSISSDASYSFREKLNENAISTILENPIFGNFVYHYSLDANGGQYAHSLIDIYARLGLFQFGLFVLLVLISSVGSLLMVAKQNGLAFLYNYSFLINISNLIMILFTKSGFFLLVPFGIGLFAASIYREKTLGGQK